MLTLTTKAGERVKIGPDITISVQEIQHGRVRIGVEAPRGVLVLREELVRDKEWDRELGVGD